MLNYKRYKANPVLDFPERTWPNKQIEKAPIWCSVDLRDGNQALVEPMNVDEKMELFDLLLKLGFKEIEIGFPAASQIEFDFLRQLVKENKIPSDVKVQVLSQCREELIDRTFEAIQGIPNVIFHIYNSTSTLQRDVVFNADKEEIIEIAKAGTQMVKDRLDRYNGNLQLEYSPESFTGTEVEFALDICTAVQETWNHATEAPIIFNLPATVEMNTPNVYADQIEWMSTHFKDRENIILSIHPHNDRGTGVAITELGLLAGADRVEGCLFGNGERTGNLDIVTVALNMFSEGVDPELDFSNLPDIADSYQEYTKMEINPRSPYAGGLAYTALSGGHQDAIAKGFAARDKMSEDAIWDVPYLLIDPHDIGRKYEGIIRINSQSGKGGSSFILEHNYGYAIPKAMQSAIGDLIKAKSDEAQRELQSEEILKFFEDQWINRKSPLCVLDLASTQVESADEKEHVACRGVINWNGEKLSIGGKGNGPLDSFVAALAETPVPKFNITAFHEHSVGQGSDTYAVAYVQITKEDGSQKWGVGKSSNVGKAGIGAVVSALNQ